MLLPGDCEAYQILRSLAGQKWLLHLNASASPDLPVSATMTTLAGAWLMFRSSTAKVLGPGAQNSNDPSKLKPGLPRIDSKSITAVRGSHTQPHWKVVALATVPCGLQPSSPGRPYC